MTDTTRILAHSDAPQLMGPGTELRILGKPYLAKLSDFVEGAGSKRFWTIRLQWRLTCLAGEWRDVAENALQATTVARLVKRGKL